MSNRPPKDNLSPSEHYEYFLEGAGLGGWDWWLDSNRVIYDRRWCKILGLEVDAVTQELSTWETLAHPDDIPGVWATVKNYFDGNTDVCENILRMRHRDGHWVWILGRGRISERDEAGKPLRFTGTHLDISQFIEKDLLSREIQKIANVGGWEMDVATKKTLWTEQTYSIHKVPLGTPTDQTAGINFYAPHEQSRLFQLVTACTQGTPYRSLFEFFDAEGSHRWVEVTGEPVRDSNGSVSKLRGTFQDVTERHTFDRNFYSQKSQLDRVLKNSPGMVYQFVMTPEGEMRFEYVSEQAFEIYEISPMEFKKNPSIMIEMVAPEFREGLHAAIKTSADTLEPFDWEGQIITPNGKSKWILARSIPERQNNSSILWDGIVIDITKQKNLEFSLNLERSKSIQNAKLASLGEMSAGVAHEINNPLAIIIGAISLLPKFIHDEVKFAAKIEKMNRAASRIEKIVKGLKTFSRTSQVLEHKVEDVSEIVSDVMTLMSVKPKMRSTSITTNVPPGLFIKCDLVEIEQVLVNLIGNALDAVKTQDESWIRVNAFAEGEHVVVQVIDSGLGISPEHRDKIFDPFFTTKVIGEGTGLGLSISKGILDSHKASFALNSSEKNTCFEVRFPMVSGAT